MASTFVVLLFVLFFEGRTEALLLSHATTRHSVIALQSKQDFNEEVLPLDFGSGDAQWRFDWPQDAKERTEARPVDVGVGGVLFVACHLNALVLTQDAAAGRLLGASAFLALQRSVSFREIGDSFKLAQQLPVDKVGMTPWPLVALGASVPTFQAVLLPALLASNAAWHFRPPDLQWDAVTLIPFCEELVFRIWAMEAARNAKLPYTASVAASGLLFGLWHGPEPTSLGFVLLGAYWAHLFAQTKNACIPIAMHVLWNIFALTNAASFDTTR